MTLSVIDPGLYTTVQDLGRPGFGHLGVSRSGAMDADSLRLSNLLAGNEPGAAALELTATGVNLQARREVVLALAGAGWSMRAEAADAVRSPGICRLVAGQTVQVDRSADGAFRAYLAVRGGLQSRAVMGSSATDSRAEIGGLKGTRLSGQEILQVGSDAVGKPVSPQLDDAEVPGCLRHLFEHSCADSHSLRATVGPHSAYFADSQRDLLFTSDWEISPNSNRVGYRLRGPQLKQQTGTLLSEGVVPGAVQVPAGGRPIMLMSDCQTMGGYPVICTVITADLPAVGRRAPGEVVRFAAVNLPEAEKISARRAAAWKRLQSFLCQQN